MVRISYTTAFRLLDQHIQKHNAQHSTLTKRIRPATLLTARELIKLYALTLLKTPQAQRADLEQLPPLITNNVQIAKRIHASPRTVQRHLKRLIDANIITKKRWRGSNASYHIYLNVNILGLAVDNLVDIPKNEVKAQNPQATKNQSIKKNKTTSCPHTDTYYTLKKNNILIAVHNLNKKRTSLPLKVNSASLDANTQKMTGYTEEKGVSPPQPYYLAEGKARNTRVKRQTGAENLPEAMTRSATLMQYALHLWEAAKAGIYENHTLTQSQERAALNWLYQWYDPVPNSKLEQVHQVYLKRLELVNAYVQRSPQTRFVQLPYTYFNPKNPNGFAGTKHWYDQQKQQHTKRQQQKLVYTYIRHFKANEAKDTSEQLPRLALFKYCETQIKHLNNPKLLDTFHTEVLKR